MTTSTGTGNNVLSLGATLSNATLSNAILVNTSVGAAAITGTLAVANGGTGVTTSTGTGSSVLSIGPTFTGDVNVTGNIVCTGSIANSGGNSMFKNYLINGGMMVNQRNFTTGGMQADAASNVLISNVFVADRWIAHRFGSNMASGSMSNLSCATSDLPFTQDGITRYARVARTDNNVSNDISLTQTLEANNATPLGGKTITLSFYARKGATFSSSNMVSKIWFGNQLPTAEKSLVQEYFLGNGSDFNEKSISLTTSWAKYTHTVTAPSAMTQIAVQLAYRPTTATSVSSDFMDITGVQLEKGSIATPFEYRPYAAELQLCQRYYEVILKFTLQCALQNGNRYASAMYRQDKRVMPRVTLVNNPENASYDAGFSSIQQASIRNSQGNYFSADILASADL